jgi:hypothetical protein
VVVGLLVVLGLGVGAVVVLNQGDDGDKVVLEPVSLVQEDDFAGNLDVGDAVAAATAAAATQAAKPVKGVAVPDPRTDTVGTVLAAHVVPGTAAGVYGGTRDTKVCDTAKLAQFLQAPQNKAKATAWAGVLHVKVADIPKYVGGLTAVRLRYDTRVTNHGFKDGKATAFQSLLQAGTAVLVDVKGVPRVKCNCGNPLGEPTPLGDTAKGDAVDLKAQAENPDDAWKGLDPAAAVAVRAADPVLAFNIVNVDEGGLLQRPVGSDGASKPDVGAGDVQVKLEWPSEADLDLHVIEPAGTEINYLKPGPTSTGGRLDADSNRDCKNRRGVENVFWPLGKAPKGHYKVNVEGFRLIHDDSSPCGPGDFTLTITVAGKPRVEKGAVGQSETKTYEFDVK